MSVAQDGRIVEERVPTPIASTACVPEGTMTTAPAASLTGPTPIGPTGLAAPVVAVNTTRWWQDPTFMTTVGGALLALVPVVEQALTDKTFNWRSFTLSCILALAAYFRNRFNTVVR